MKYKTPDIKTADVFFEILSNPKRTLEHIGMMRTIRDEIREGLGLSETKDKTEKLLRDASAKMTEATEFERAARADNEAASGSIHINIKPPKLSWL